MPTTTTTEAAPEVDLGPPRMPLPDPATHPTITVDQAAHVYGLSRSAAYSAVKAGEIPAIRVGGRWLVPTARVRRDLGLDP